MLVSTPNNTLTSGDYRYQVQNLSSSDGKEQFNRTFDNNFTIEIEDSVFSIDDISIDNNNGYSQGEILVPTNTAGIEDDSSDNSSYARLFLPASIHSLEYFNLTAVSVTRENDESTVFSSFDIVRDSEVKLNKRQLISLAKNEIVKYEGSSHGHYLHTSLPDGEYYSAELSNIHYYFSDDTLDNKNSITFKYEYLKKGNDTVQTGILTLPIR